MVNQVVHRVYASSETSEDTESESELNNITSDVSREISRSCFPDLLPKHQTDKTGTLLSRKLITSFKALTKTRARWQDDSKPMEEFLREMARERLARYSLKQIKSFTWNFSSVLGKGAFGTTYKGLMPNGVYVAVKQTLSKDKFVEEMFMAEVSTLGRTYHRNIVKLLGYCVDGDLKALVYEYVANGSLDKFLLNNCNGMDWEMIQNIAIETAKGISYLHEECPEVIVHLDVKPGNILLDQNLSPKLADFGLALQYDMDRDDGIDATIRGTFGYTDPSFFRSNYVTCKCDVYSFGMVLFDILGRYNLKGCDREFFLKQVWKKFNTGNLDYLKEEEGRMSMAALWCIQDMPEDRPSMSTVVNILRGDTEVVQPPYPFSSFSKAYGSYTSTPSARFPSRGREITEIIAVHGGPDCESDSAFFPTPTTEKYEIKMATSPDKLIMESNTLIHTANFSLPSRYMKAFPPKIVPYITLLKDVKGDGNCGFRALADLLGMTENGWVSAREDLLAELRRHWEDYSRLYEQYGSIHRLKNSLEYYGNNAPLEYWMDMPDMGHIIASCYNVVLVHISLEQCLTFLPLRSTPLPEQYHEIICIGLVNRNHFVRLDLQEGCPIPSIAERWHLNRHPCAKGWETSYTSRIQHFEELVMGENVALREIPTEICTNSFRI